jgi:hypothetical protein
MIEESRILGRAKAMTLGWSCVSQWLPKKVQDYFDGISGFLLLGR